MDDCKIRILTLLDVSAAFDTIDHNILLRRLQHTFDIGDSALSFLSDRTQIVLAFKSVNNDGPSYLSDLLKFYIPSRQLPSSSDTRLLRIPSFRLKFCGQRIFSYQASVLWNSLPISLRHSSSMGKKPTMLTYLRSSCMLRELKKARERVSARYNSLPFL